LLGRERDCASSRGTERQRNRKKRNRGAETHERGERNLRRSGSRAGAPGGRHKAEQREGSRRTQDENRNGDTERGRRGRNEMGRNKGFGIAGHERYE